MPCRIFFVRFVKFIIHLIFLKKESNHSFIRDRRENSKLEKSKLEWPSHSNFISFASFLKVFLRIAVKVKRHIFHLANQNLIFLCLCTLFLRYACRKRLLIDVDRPFHQEDARKMGEKIEKGILCALFCLRPAVTPPLSSSFPLPSFSTHSPLPPPSPRHSLPHPLLDRDLKFKLRDWFLFPLLKKILILVILDFSTYFSAWPWFYCFTDCLALLLFILYFEE